MAEWGRREGYCPYHFGPSEEIRPNVLCNVLMRMKWDVSFGLTVICFSIVGFNPRQ